MEEYYNEEQLREAALAYFKGDELASNVWISKYALKNNKGPGYLELTPDDTIERIINEIHRTEKKYPNPLSKEEISEMLKDFKNFIFAGSILFGLGNPNNVSLGNCFFIDNGADSYGGIFSIDESMAQLMKRRGGVGVTIEHLRPNSSKVNNSAQSSTGSVSFMPRYSNTTREVAQDGRRGALMITTHIDHPDSPEFAIAKDDLTKITGANVSIKVTNKFMKAVEGDQDYILSWPISKEEKEIKENIPYNKLIKLEDGRYVRRIKAKTLWDTIVKQAHKNAEPGILFWDNVIEESPADCYQRFGFETKGTNPCITGDALINTDKGKLTIPQIIERYKSEDIQALTFNETYKEVEYKNIEVAQKTKENTNIIEIETEDGETLKLTPDHKVYTENRGWVEAVKLLETDILILIDNE
ncbi:MAG: hypothetical protein ACOC1K_02160 [Nanoarchaeota archaeon]